MSFDWPTGPRAIQVPCPLPKPALRHRVLRALLRNHPHGYSIAHALVFFFLFSFFSFFRAFSFFVGMFVCEGLVVYYGTFSLSRYSLESKCMAVSLHHRVTT